MSSMHHNIAITNTNTHVPCLILISTAKKGDTLTKSANIQNTCSSKCPSSGDVVTINTLKN